MCERKPAPCSLSVPLRVEKNIDTRKVWGRGGGRETKHHQYEKCSQPAVQSHALVKVDVSIPGRDWDIPVQANAGVVELDPSLRMLVVGKAMCLVKCAPTTGVHSHSTALARRENKLYLAFRANIGKVVPRSRSLSGVCDEALQTVHATSILGVREFRDRDNCSIHINTTNRQQKKGALVILLGGPSTRSHTFSHTQTPLHIS